MFQDIIEYLIQLFIGDSETKPNETWLARLTSRACTIKANEIISKFEYKIDLNV